MSDRYHGFELSSVCWGYREIFAQTLEGLFAQGVIGDDRPEATQAFFRLMRCAEQQHFDYVLKEFLAALNPQTSWLMAIPGVFADVTQLGRELAETKLHFGISYFRVLGNGGLGGTPEQVRYLIAAVRRLRAIDDQLAMSFLSGYGDLISQLEPAEIDVYLEQGIRAFHQNPATGLRFLAGELKSSQLTIRALTREARLADMESSLTALLRALVGYSVELADLSQLDSDDLIERSTRMVCLYRWLYLPSRVRDFDTVAENRNWYRLCAVTAAGMLSFNTFSRIHGHPAYRTCADLVGDNVLAQNCLQILEYARAVRGIRRTWPGARSLLDFGIGAELGATGRRESGRMLLLQLLRDQTAPSAASGTLPERFLAIADASVNVFDTVALMSPDLLVDLAATYPDLARSPLRPLAFLPDFLYPGAVSSPPPDTLIADLKSAAQRRRSDEYLDGEAAEQRVPGDADPDQTDDGGKANSGVRAAYVYDEWSQQENDYYRDYCLVTELRPEGRGKQDLPADVMVLGERTRRVFEMLRPELTKEKYLQEGDEINVDLLTEHLVARHREPSPRVNFYEKPSRQRRDLATLILLDVSGSTGSEIERLKTIEIEKRAALVLGQGLAALGDRFAITGFSGTGRERCEFFVYKDFDDGWDREAIGSVMAAHPRSATRIGAALRHAGYRLSLVAARQRLIVLITDGKPMDTGYDPNTRYAQYDVRMACEENERHSIHTFCITTDDNSIGDMELMFPRHRYIVLSDVRALPHLLPSLYVRLTA